MVVAKIGRMAETVRSQYGLLGSVGASTIINSWKCPMKAVNRLNCSKMPVFLLSGWCVAETRLPAQASAKQLRTDVSISPLRGVLRKHGPTANIRPSLRLLLLRCVRHAVLWPKGLTVMLRP